jgi:hypothetical protein
LKILKKGASIHSAAKKLGIPTQKSFDRRYEIFSALQASLPQHVCGVPECDKMEFAESFKG